MTEFLANSKLVAEIFQSSIMGSYYKKMLTEIRKVTKCMVLLEGVPIFWEQAQVLRLYLMMSFQVETKSYESQQPIWNWQCLQGKNLALEKI